MQLFRAVSTEYAKQVIEDGFVGTEVAWTDEASKPTGEVQSICEFRDMPPTGLTSSLTTEVTVEAGEEDFQVTFAGGPVLADDLGDFVLSIEVPVHVATKYEVREDPPMGMPFREFWLPEEVANEYRGSLRVFDSTTVKKSGRT